MDQKPLENTIEQRTNAGLIGVYTHHNGQIMGAVELLCETDFAARTEEFGNASRTLARHVAAISESETMCFDELLTTPLSGLESLTVGQYLDRLSQALGEKVEIGRHIRMQVLATHNEVSDPANTGCH